MVVAWIRAGGGGDGKSGDGLEQVACGLGKRVGGRSDRTLASELDTRDGRIDKIPSKLRMCCLSRHCAALDPCVSARRPPALGEELDRLVSKGVSLSSRILFPNKPASPGSHSAPHLSK